MGSHYPGDDTEKEIATTMPIIRIEMLQGRSPAIKDELVARITDVAVATLGVEPEQVRVLIYELLPEHWAVGGRTKAATIETSVPSEQ